MAELEASHKICEKNIRSLREYSDQQLVESCLNNNRNAWEEFFRRFIPDIKRGIQSKLIENGLSSLIHKKDVLADIHEKIVIKLYKEGKLIQCRNINGIIPWLKTIARNQTVDWIKAENRNKRLPKKESELNTLSLSEPLNGNSHLTIGETILDESSNFIFKKDLDDLFNKIVDIKDEQKYWIFRLSIISTLPLSNNEINELSKYNNITSDQLKSKLNIAYQLVKKKEAKRLESLSKAVLNWHVIKRLKSILKSKENQLNSYNNINFLNDSNADDTPNVQDMKKDYEDNIENLKKSTEEKMKKRKKFLEDGNKLSRPSNKMIAELIGLPENKTNQISNILIRIREQIIKNQAGF